MPHVPDEIKFKIRLPERVAYSEANMDHLAEVKFQIQAYLDQNIKVNLLDATKPLDFNTTVGEVQAMACASSVVRQAADSGALADTHKKFNDLEAQRLEAESAFFEDVQNTIDNCNLNERQIVDELEEKNILEFGQKNYGSDSISAHFKSAFNDVAQNEAKLRARYNNEVDDSTKKLIGEYYGRLAQIASDRAEAYRVRYEAYSVYSDVVQGKAVPASTVTEGDYEEY